MTPCTHWMSSVFQVASFKKTSSGGKKLLQGTTPVRTVAKSACYNPFTANNVCQGVLHHSSQVYVYVSRTKHWLFATQSLSLTPEGPFSDPV